MTLNYGTRPMRDMLRGYGFTPAHAAVTDPSEVYEEIGEACETLIVQGSGRVNTIPAPVPFSADCEADARISRWWRSSPQPTETDEEVLS